VFGWVIRVRRSQYKCGKRPSYRAPIPVIVVGNITAGGNGKTPVVVWLVEQLKQMGFSPGVVSRGYGGRAPTYPLIVKSDTPTKHCGDEPKLIFSRTSAYVAVSPVRAEAVQALLPLGIDIVITDDGLQHYALERDLEIIVVDGSRKFGNESLIPLGPLREPLWRLKEADIIISNGGKGGAREQVMSLVPDDAVNLKTDERRDISSLRYGAVAMAGIGHPQRFFNMLESLGIETTYEKGFADHKSLERSELEQLAEKGEYLLMTEKDAVKCIQYASDKWWYLPVSAQFSEQDTSFILSKILVVMAKY
jgi:tetraacyldisaccharide 4'-kinase